MFSTRLRALSVFVVLAAAGSGLLLAQSPQAVGTWVGVGTADNPFGNGAHVDVGDGHTLIVGGTAPDGAATNVVANFDTATNQFAIAGTLLSARTGHTATLLKDGRVLVTGGTTNSLVSTDIELFDPSTGSSTLVAQMAEPRRGHVAALLQNGNVLIAGGYTTGDVVLQSAFIFDPATNSISPTPGGLNVARASASATSLIDGNVVVIGGTDGTNDLRSAEIFNPFSQSFSIVSTQLSVPVRGHSAVLLPNNGSVLIAGGTSNDVAQAGAELFLPAEFPDPFSWGIGQFAPIAAMSAARSGAIAGPTAAEGYSVVTGGGSSNVERYRFATIKTDKDDYAPGEPALITGSGWQPNEEVRLLFQEDPAVHDDYTLTLTADGEGNINHDQWAPEQHDLGVRFYLLAKGQQSGRQAQMTFLDGNNEKTTVTVSCSPNPVVVGSATTCQAQVNNDESPALNGYPQGSVTFTSTGGLTGSFSPVSATCTLVQIGSTLNSGCGGVSFTPSSDVDGSIKATYNRTDNRWANANENTSLTVNPAATPNVTVAVAPASVTEDGAPNLVYTFSRTGSTTSALNGVNFSVTGTASFSTDYTQTGAASFTSSTGTVNFATGSSTAIVTVNPSTDSTFEPNETVILTVSSGTGYNVGTPSSATGTITNDDPEPNTTPSVEFTTAPNTANEGDTKTYNFSITDPDAGQTFSFVSGFPDCGTGGTLVGGSASISGSTGSFQCSFPDGPITPNPNVRVQVQDSFSTPASSNIASVGVVVSNLAPVVVLAGDSSANEGQTKHYTFTVSDVLADTFTGVASCGVSAAANYTVTGNSGSQSGSFDCTFPDGPVTPKPMVSITFTDDDNGVGSDNKEVTVANVAPTVVLTGPETANEGQATHYTFTVSDVPLDTYTGVANCDVGSLTNYTVTGTSNSQSGSFDCTFPDGPVTPKPMVGITFTDDDNGVGSDNKEVTVANVAPTVVLTGPASANEGETKHYTFTVSDVPADTYGPGVASCGTGSLSSYTATGNSGSQSGSFDCTFPDNAATTVSISFTDDDGGVGSDSKTVSVANLAPVVLFLSGDTTAYEGQAKHYTFTVSDVPADTYGTGVASCGGGFLANYTVTGSSGSQTGSFDCTFGDGPVMPKPLVSITFTDDDGGVGSASKEVTVTNVAPSNTGHTFTFNPFTGFANASISFSDPGWLDTVSASFNWAGFSAAGSPVGVGAVPPGPLTGTFNGSHTFTGCVAGAIDVTVDDGDGGSFNYVFAPANTLGTYTASFMAPIKDGARNIVKVGNVIPVKVQVLDCQGNPVLNRTLTVWLVSGILDAEDITEGDLTLATSVSAADTGNQMRVADGHYMFNLATKGLKNAAFTIIIRDSATGTLNIATAVIDLKK